MCLRNATKQEIVPPCKPSWDWPKCDRNGCDGCEDNQSCHFLSCRNLWEVDECQIELWDDSRCYYSDMEIGNSCFNLWNSAVAFQFKSPPIWCWHLVVILMNIGSDSSKSKSPGNHSNMGSPSYLYIYFSFLDDTLNLILSIFSSS